MSEDSLQIVPGATWTATNTGLHIQSHGAGLIEVDGVYYMIGEDKTQGTFFQNINAYSSTNLVEWTWEGALLTRASDGDLGQERIVERPKIIYNAHTATYVMYMHIDNADYSEARVGVAICKTVVGSYEYKGSFRPLDCESRDIGLFKDDDGSAYLLAEDRVNGLRIMALSDDYCKVISHVYCWKECIESPAIWKSDEHYYMFGSHLTGWDCNDNVYSYAPALRGPWSPWREFADLGSKTYESQISTVLPFGDMAVYLGDRWCPSNLAQSTYVWLLLSKKGHEIYMKDQTSWTLNLSCQRENETLPEVHNEIDSKVLPQSGFSCHLASSSNARTTLRLKYTNAEIQSQQGTVTVNGVSQKIDFLPTGSQKQGIYEVSESVVHCELGAGHENVVTITEVGTHLKILEVIVPGSS
ncbi:galactan 1-3-beta-galactosidase [Penicillium cataractarum]|uniref:Galactan 1-3-beta-galactosidase n=1 Tax=Penicillium cataractarum TaxID=2100454 RepID=A0A9W9S5L1_9EURO|nr:galactan 1-3-beta-galactosidase [Penicillium cataractarum]KAJ5371059.1 galactan 1-3-beta-galactosidase [Penicillium cataractarum]